MSIPELRDALDRAVGDVRPVDVVESAWERGRAMRRRRRAAYTGGGLLVAAAAAAGIISMTGGLPGTPGPLDPATPTSTVSDGLPTEGIGEATTFVFTRAVADVTVDPATLPDPQDAEVPTLDELRGTEWMLLTDHASEVIGSEAGTSLHFLAVDHGTLLSVDIEGCGGATFQEDLVLADDGRFAGQDAGTTDIGCSPAVQTAEDFWMETLPHGGWIHLVDRDVLLLSVLPPDGGTSEDEPSETDATGDLPEGTVAIGTGHGIVVPDGWRYLPLGAAELTNNDIWDPRVTNSTCLLPESVVELGATWCDHGVEVRTGVLDARYDEQGWWDPTDTEGRLAESCYADPAAVDPWANPVTFTDPETGEGTAAGQAYAWFRWSATCQDGQSFTAEAWRFPGLGIELRSVTGEHELAPFAETLVPEAEVPGFAEHMITVTEPIGPAVVGEYLDWAPGGPVGNGETVEFALSEETICLVTVPGAGTGEVLQVGSCDALEDERGDAPFLNVVVDGEGAVLSVRVNSGT